MRRKQRTQSLYSSVKINDKQHCPEDLACAPNLKYLQPLNKQIKILTQKNQTLNQDKQDYLKEIMRLNKVIKAWEKRQREFRDLEEVKRRLRLEIKAELEDQRRVDDMIVKEKLATQKKEKEILQKEKAELLAHVDQFSKKFETVTKDYKILEEKHQKLQKQFENKSKLLDNSEEQVVTLKKRIKQLQSALKDKTDLITQLQGSLSTSQQNYMIEKAKNGENQLSLLKTKQEVKLANISIQELKQQTAKKKACIQQLSQQKGSLQRTVHNLNSTVQTYGILQGQLRNRILVSQQYAIQKQLQNKQLQSDFYDAIYRRSI